MTMRLTRLLLLVVVLVVLSVALTNMPSDSAPPPTTPPATSTSSSSSSSSSSSPKEADPVFEESFLQAPKATSPEDREDDFFLTQRKDPNRSRELEDSPFPSCDPNEDQEKQDTRVEFLGILTLTESAPMIEAFVDHYLNMRIPPSCMQITVEPGATLTEKKLKAVKKLLEQKGIQFFNNPDEQRARYPEAWKIQARSTEFQEYPLPLPNFLDLLEKAGIDTTVGKVVDRVARNGQLPDVRRDFIQAEFDLACEIETQLGISDGIGPGPSKNLGGRASRKTYSRIRIHNFAWTSDLISERSKSSLSPREAVMAQFLEQHQGVLPVQDPSLQCQSVAALPVLLPPVLRERRPVVPNPDREKPHMDFDEGDRTRIDVMIRDRARQRVQKEFGLLQ